MEKFDDKRGPKEVEWLPKRQNPVPIYTRSRNKRSTGSLVIVFSLVGMFIFGLTALIIQRLINTLPGMEDMHPGLLSVSGLVNRRHLPPKPWDKPKTTPIKYRNSKHNNKDEEQNDNSYHSSTYKETRKEHEESHPPQDTERIQSFVRNLRKPLYKPMFFESYDVNNCPDTPPPNYPMEWPILDILNNWNPHNTTFPSLSQRPSIYQGLCRFDHKTEFSKALAYRNAELPFILRDDPQVNEVVERWNQPTYLPSVLGSDIQYSAEYSKTNHLMYYKSQKPKILQRLGFKNWKPPMSTVKITYDKWVEKALQPLEETGPDKPHWYFRINGKKEDHFMYEELPFFKPKKNFYIVNDKEGRGINCRFGMRGNIAEAHFDGSRNFVMIFGGERRYILSHPKSCSKLGLYPRGHPSARHSALDWSKPDLESFPEFREAMANEVVMQAGDALYLPTSWLHFIISLDLNWQCNARSGVTHEFKDHIKTCGF